MRKADINKPRLWICLLLVLMAIAVQAIFGSTAQGWDDGTRGLAQEPQLIRVLPGNSSAKGARPVNTSENIHLFNNAYYAFDEELNGEEGHLAVDRNVRYAAEHYDLNLVNWYNLFYYPYLITRFHQYKPLVMVLMNYGSFCCLTERDDWYDDADQHHDEWFLKDSNGQRINWDSRPDHWFMDIDNPEYQDYWITHMIVKARWVAAGQDGWDGVYINNVNTAMWGGLERNTTYLTNGEYERAAYNYLAHVYTHFQQAGIPILINLSPSPSVYSYAEWASLTDGIKIGSFATTWSGYQSLQTWERQISGLEEIGRAGKISAVYPQFSDDNLQARIYGLASYLLGKQGSHDFFYYQIQDAETFFPPVWLPEWETKIGYPIGDRYKEQGVWQREYSHGKVLVNPTSNAYSVDLAGWYQTLDGVQVNKITLRGHEGAILLSVLLPYRTFLTIIIG